LESNQEPPGKNKTMFEISNGLRAWPATLFIPLLGKRGRCQRSYTISKAAFEQIIGNDDKQVVLRQSPPKG